MRARSKNGNWKLSHEIRDAGVNIAVAEDAKQRIPNTPPHVSLPCVVGGSQLRARSRARTQKVERARAGLQRGGTRRRQQTQCRHGYARASTVGWRPRESRIMRHSLAGRGAALFPRYLALGNSNPASRRAARRSMSRSAQAGFALIAAKPRRCAGFYPPCEYDLSGFNRRRCSNVNLLTAKRPAWSHFEIALPSAGAHHVFASLAHWSLNR